MQKNSAVNKNSFLLLTGGGVWGPDVENKCWFWNLKFDNLNCNKWQECLILFQNCVFMKKMGYLGKDSTNYSITLEYQVW